MIALWVGLGALVGAPLRYVTDRALQQRWDTRFPMGTLTVNLVACLVLGVLAGSRAVDPEVAALVGTGLCGALSTWSTLGFETVRLIEVGAGRMALGNAALSIAGGIGLAALGWWAAASW